MHTCKFVMSNQRRHGTQTFVRPATGKLRETTRNHSVTTAIVQNHTRKRSIVVFYKLLSIMKHTNMSFFLKTYDMIKQVWYLGRSIWWNRSYWGCPRRSTSACNYEEKGVRHDQRGKLITADEIFLTIKHTHLHSITGWRRWKFSNRTEENGKEEIHYQTDDKGSQRRQ